MGWEHEKGTRTNDFNGYQLNAALYSHCAPDAVVMHCLPMVRGEEISDEMADCPRSVLFKQSENRLHVQKSLLLKLLAPAKMPAVFI
jgi:ornithine carbamoyltransferase